MHCFKQLKKEHSYAPEGHYLPWIKSSDRDSRHKHSVKLTKIFNWLNYNDLSWPPTASFASDSVCATALHQYSG